MNNIFVAETEHPVRSKNSSQLFARCPLCAADYGTLSDRRFDSESPACPNCTLQGWGVPPRKGDDAIATAASLLREGVIIAIKDLRGCQFVCDAANPTAVAKLRATRQRDGRPLSLMGRDLGVVRRHGILSWDEERELSSPPAPVVMLPVRKPGWLADAIAPGLSMIGWRLPGTVLQALLLTRFDGPLAVSGLADEPALAGPGELASAFLYHEHATAERTPDDSVVRFMDGEPRVLHTGRGHAPTPIDLPEGFENAPSVVAVGGSQTTTLCMIKDGRAIFSGLGTGHEGAGSFEGCVSELERHHMFDQAWGIIAADLQPAALSSNLARTLDYRVLWVQHHHAHIASCLCENGYPLNGPPVLGIALDGSDWGNDGTLWGGEFLLSDYRGFRRLASLKPVAMPGGTHAVREPWRNLLAHIASAIGLDEFNAEFAGLKLLDGKPHRTLTAMMRKNFNAPLASSCGRLFDAVAAALNVCADRQHYDGDAPARLEAVAEHASTEGAPYPFALSHCVESGSRMLDPAPMWRALFSDLSAGTPASIVAARFHNSVAKALADTAAALAQAEGFHTVALSGECFHNRLLFERATRYLTAAGFVVLTHSRLPADDGGISLGQAAVAAAWLMPVRAKQLGRQRPL